MREEKKPFEGKYKNYQAFEINFTEKKKYNPATRTVIARSKNEEEAILFFARMFDSLKFDELLAKFVPSRKKVIINTIKAIEG